MNLETANEGLGGSFKRAGIVVYARSGMAADATMCEIGFKETSFKMSFPCTSTGSPVQFPVDQFPSEPDFQHHRLSQTLRTRHQKAHGRIRLSFISEQAEGMRGLYARLFHLGLFETPTLTFARLFPRRGLSDPRTR